MNAALTPPSGAVSPGPQASAGEQDDRRRVRLAVALVFLVSLAIGALVGDLLENNLILRKRGTAAEVASIHGHLLQERLDRGLSATYALAAVLRQGKGRIDNFNALASDMLRLYSGTNALAIAPAGIVTQIVPLAGNEAAVGHNLLQDPRRNKEALAAIASRQLTLAGPFPLRQGGVGVVGRLAVFLPDGQGQERFWGFTSALLRIADLLAASQLRAIAEGQYDYELSRIHPDSGKRDVFAASSPRPLVQPVSYAFEVPNGRWTLSLAPVGGWQPAPLTRVGATLAVVVASLLAAALVRHLLLQLHALRREVAERTRAQQALHREQEHQQALIRKLEEAQNQLLQSEKMASIGQLAAGVAHEINNPIGFVGSNLATLRRHADDLLTVLAAYEHWADPLLADHHRAEAEILAAKTEADLAYLRDDLPTLLEETQDGVRRVRDIVRDLKEFSHVSEAEWQFADLHRGLESTINVVWHELKYKVDLVREYGQLPAVECIASQINQVLMNLLVNAAQAIPDTGVVTLRSGHADGQVWIEVADSGRGIPAEIRHRIFEPFFTTKPVGQGTGLGLSLAYGIISRHGGRIEVDSVPGEGSRFRVWLPVRQAVPAAEPLPL